MAEEKNYNVSLEINLTGCSPLEAAKNLQRILMDSAEFLQYYVQEEGCKEIFSVDLAEEAEDTVLQVVNYQSIIQY